MAGVCAEFEVVLCRIAREVPKMEVATRLRLPWSCVSATRGHVRNSSVMPNSSVSLMERGGIGDERRDRTVPLVLEDFGTAVFVAAWYRDRSLNKNTVLVKR